jgi:hypothetical protein
MKQSFLAILIFCSVYAYGQTNPSRSKSHFLSFMKFKNHGPDLRWNRTTPIFTSFVGSSLESSFSYWQGASYTTFSRNGRLRTTNLFDVHGQLRETRSSVSLKKSGVLSYWRLQISPQRTRPLLVYTIH